MADTLALLHWSAQIDACDVEYVLAAAEDEHSMPSTKLGLHRLYILDFDLCKEMTMDEAGVDQAVAAFLRNDRYYPRPGMKHEADRALWVVFRDRFLESSASIWHQPEGGGPELPALFIRKLETLLSSTGIERR